MKASLKLIQQLRGQLPPEAAESLDELESMAGDGEDEEDLEDPMAEDLGADSDDEYAGDPMAEDDEAMPPSKPKAKAKSPKPKMPFFS